MCRSSVSFPNKNIECPGGKAHDIEIRVALSLFNRWKRASKDGQVTMVSDLGLTRQLKSAKDLADLLVYPLECFFRKEGLANDIRCQSSGMICIVTNRRAHVLRVDGKLPCPICTKWCKGEKGLWWHQQQSHKVTHAEATAFASSSTDVMALVPYNPGYQNLLDCRVSTNKATQPSTDAESEPLEFIKRGNLLELKQAISVS